MDEITLGELVSRPRNKAFTFPGGRRSEPVRGESGEVVGVLVRAQEVVDGEVNLSAVEVSDGLYRLTLRVANRTPMGGGTRDDALLRALVSTHSVLGVRDGEFVSLLEPPDRWRVAAAACRNVGTWPVLVGAGGQTETMLSSPIILYDYSQIAPESPGDLFDSTEIDEILTLRTMTLTDEEKRAARATDPRAAELLDRLDHLPPEMLERMHGAIRYLNPADGPARGPAAGPGTVPEWTEPPQEQPGEPGVRPIPGRR